MGFYWLIFIFAFLLIEGLSMNLITIWFAVGSLFAFIGTYFTNNLYIQLIIFVITTIISLVLTRPLIKKYINENIVKTNYDVIIGKVGTALTDINPLEKGRVKVDGKEWMATSKEEIKKGEKVKILKIEGVKVIVKREDD